MQERNDIRGDLAKLGRSQKELAYWTGISYGRLTACTEGFREFRPHEEAKIRRLIAVWTAGAHGIGKAV